MPFRSDGLRPGVCHFPSNAADGKFYCIAGKNSSGKSTFVSCIASLLKYSGSINLDGTDVSSFTDRERAKKICHLSQNVLPVPFTVQTLCSFGRNAYGENSAVVSEKVRQALDTMKISHLADKRVDELSGGEMQLSYFAMNLCQDSDIFLLDEPTSNLDIDREAQILSRAKELCRCGKTVICVIHNLSAALKYADDILVLDGGRSIFSGSRNDCLEKCIIEENFGVKRYETDGEIFFSV